MVKQLPFQKREQFRGIRFYRKGWVIDLVRRKPDWRRALPYRRRWKQVIRHAPVISMDIIPPTASQLAQMILRLKNTREAMGLQ